MKYLLILNLACLFLACQAGTSVKNTTLTPSNAQSQSIAMPDSLNNYLDQLASEHGPDRQEAIQWLVAHAELSRLAIRDLVEDENTSPWRLSGGFEVLGAMGKAEDLQLLKACALNRPQNQWEAVLALAHHSHPDALESLLETAQSEDESLAANSLVALGIKMDERARPLLEEKAVNGSDKIRWKAVHALSLLGVDASRQLLEEQLALEKDKDVAAKLVAVLANKP